MKKILACLFQHPPPVLIQEFCKHRIQVMNALIQNPFIGYESKKINTFFPGKPFHEVSNIERSTLRHLGFTKTEDSLIYRHTPNTPPPSMALHHLLGLKPLFIDCTQAIAIADYMAYITLFGPQAFDRFIEEVCHNMLVLGPNSTVPYEELVLDRSTHVTEDMLLSYAQPGDRVYIQGCSTYEIYHAYGIGLGLNGYFQRHEGQPHIIGFGEPEDNTDFPAILNWLETEHRAPLSIRDLYDILLGEAQHPHTIISESNITYAEALQTLVSEQQHEVFSHLKSLDDDKDYIPFEPSRVHVPQPYRQEQAIGLQCIARVTNLILFEQKEKRKAESQHEKSKKPRKSVF